MNWLSSIMFVVVVVSIVASALIPTASLLKGESVVYTNSYATYTDCSDPATYPAYWSIEHLGNGQYAYTINEKTYQVDASEFPIVVGPDSLAVGDYWITGKGSPTKVYYDRASKPYTVVAIIQGAEMNLSHWTGNDDYAFYVYDPTGAGILFSKSPFYTRSNSSEDYAGLVYTASGTYKGALPIDGGIGLLYSGESASVYRAQVTWESQAVQDGIYQVAPMEAKAVSRDNPNTIRDLVDPIVLCQCPAKIVVDGSSGYENLADLVVVTVILAVTVTTLRLALSKRFNYRGGTLPLHRGILWKLL